MGSVFKGSSYLWWLLYNATWGLLLFETLLWICGSIQVVGFGLVGPHSLLQRKLHIPVNARCSCRGVGIHHGSQPVSRINLIGLHGQAMESEASVFPD